MDSPEWIKEWCCLSINGLATSPHFRLRAHRWMGGILHVDLSSRQRSAACPICQHRPGAVHSPIGARLPTCRSPGHGSSARPPIGISPCRSRASGNGHAIAGRRSSRP